MMSEISNFRECRQRKLPSVCARFPEQLKFSEPTSTQNNLRKICPIMVLRNFDIANGHCNGMEHHTLVRNLSLSHQVEIATDTHILANVCLYL